MDSPARFSDISSVGWVRKNIYNMLLGFAAAVVILAAAFTIYNGVNSQWAHQENTAKSANAAREQAGEQLKRYCAPLPPQSEGECRREVEDSFRDYYRDSRDLEAQRTTASWTALMGAAALIGMAVSILGVGLIWKTFKETQRTARAAADSNRIAQEAMSADHRAWLSIKLVINGRLKPGNTHLGVSGYYLDVRGVAKNHGRAPAFAVELHCDVVLVGPDRPDADAAAEAFADGWRARGSSTGPILFGGEEMPVQHMLFIPQAEIDNALTQRDFKIIAPCIIGCLNYRTTHVEGIRQTRFRYFVVALQNGVPVVIQPTEKGWWQRDIDVADHESIIAD